MRGQLKKNREKAQERKKERKKAREKKLQASSAGSLNLYMNRYFKINQKNDLLYLESFI